jgi:mannitol-1-phosphate/altronate dehydrogenase
VNIVLQDADLWDTDLTKIPGFEQEVTEKLKMMITDGLQVTLQSKKLLQYK